ncbi:hypothetical protein JXJ21_11740 [candidate division KSB1 bacterium]|nr:hypothetical protein [candidate division KSB1 bacterium]
MSVKIETGNPLFDDFYAAIEHFLKQDQVTYVIDGERVHGYRSPDCNAIWIRDHSDMLRGARYFETDMLSAVSHFADTQRENGAVFDLVSCAMDRENWAKYVRVPVEADVEFRFVKAIYLGWQATGNDGWLRWILHKAEKALLHTLSHPLRWSYEHQLVKRAFTIDTWDFDFVEAGQPWLNFQISDKTHWGIFHGDNSGLYEACILLSILYQHLDNSTKQLSWLKLAADIQQKANALCWNGRFYRHRVPLDNFSLPDVNEAEQLSLSNPMAINRGMATHEMAVAMLREYQQRKIETGSFAEWFSIDPPFPDGFFGDPKLVRGAYVNGGIMPLVGGELARAAFEHGFETYGVSILRQYAEMIRASGETYLWYFPDGTPSSVETSTSPEATPTDGWGASAMLYAFIEGLAGVVDADRLFKKVRLAPRWRIAGVENAKVSVGYGASDAQLTYQIVSAPGSDYLIIEGNSMIELHYLLQQGSQAAEVSVNGMPIPFHNATIENSRYVDATFPVVEKAIVRINLK